MERALIAAKPVRVTLHGGLGNQLFQLIRGIAETRRLGSSELRLYPDLLSRYARQQVIEVSNLLELHRPIRVLLCPIDRLASLRLPKIAARLSRKERAIRIPGYGTLLDGYFQTLEQYQDLDCGQLRSTLDRWRQFLVAEGILGSQNLPAVTHIRLGDFFRDKSTAWQFARYQLRRIARETALVTDDEETVGDLLRRWQLPFSVSLRSTRGLSAWKLLSILSQYKMIQTNGSTLAFWAAVLSRAHFESSNLEHVALWRLFTEQQP